MLSFSEIEAGRKKARIPKKELCCKAGVHVSTYRRLRLGEHSPTVRTLDNLATALRDLTLAMAQ